MAALSSLHFPPAAGREGDYQGHGALGPGQGAIPSPMSRADFSRLVASQNELWKKVIQDIRFEKL